MKEAMVRSLVRRSGAGDCEGRFEVVDEDGEGDERFSFRVGVGSTRLCYSIYYE